MLHITPEAGLTIRKLVDSEGVGTGGGLHVEARANEPDFEISVSAMRTRRTW